MTTGRTPNLTLLRDVAARRVPESAGWPLSDLSRLTVPQARTLREAVGDELASLDFHEEDWSEGSPGTLLEELIDVLAAYLPDMG